MFCNIRSQELPNGRSLRLRGGNPCLRVPQTLRRGATAEPRNTETLSSPSEGGEGGGGRKGLFFPPLFVKLSNQTLRGLLCRYPTALGASRSPENNAPTQPWGAVPLSARSGCSRFCVRPQGPARPAQQWVRGLHALGVAKGNRSGKPAGWGGAVRSVPAEG